MRRLPFLRHHPRGQREAPGLRRRRQEVSDTVCQGAGCNPRDGAGEVGGQSAGAGLRDVVAKVEGKLQIEAQCIKKEYLIKQRLTIR